MEHNAGTASRELSDAIAVEIQVHLLRREMTQADLAERMGVSEMWISRRLKLRGQRQEISVNELGRFAEALGVGVVDLLPRQMRSGSMSTKTSLTRRIRPGAVRTIIPPGADRMTGRVPTPNARPGVHTPDRPAHTAQRLSRLPQ